MKTSKEYRLQASEALKGKYGLAIGTIIVYDLLTAILGFTVVGAIVLSGALLVGLSICQLNLLRNGDWKLGDLFTRMNSGNFSGTIGLYVRTAIRTFLWALLGIIPGIIASLRYAMAPYIMADNPEMTGKDAIEASKEMMKGKKGKLFCLQLSYIGWILLCCLTCGILFLWVQPRMQVAVAAFYEDAKNAPKEA